MRMDKDDTCPSLCWSRWSIAPLSARHGHCCRNPVLCVFVAAENQSTQFPMIRREKAHIYVEKHRGSDEDVGHHVPGKPCLRDSVVRRTLKWIPWKYGAPTIAMDLTALVLANLPWICAC